ncbi:DUF559 domain-containing protein [Actinomadura barringtoniae]|uniref:DUF559 domain-containing protein n=1 Tax=Actinomadura barringtoniae TaxID=1427535 RepID=A0A939PFM8_9ACTN|nr:DUF559 domain-containing protein [Actinomadura barringtoniae]MBO2451800.1 DUF559 domain-containing protein [Actinomadura barringtoniae]
MRYDVYRWSGLKLDRHGRAEAVVLGAPPGAVVSGRWAAWFHDVDVLRRTDDRVEVTVPRTLHLKSDSERRVRHAEVPGEDIAIVNDIPVTSVFRTAFDLSRLRPPKSGYEFVEAVVAVDALAHRHRIDSDAFLAYALAHRGWPGVRLVEPVLELSDARAESPMETRLRMLLVSGGLPVPEVQYEVAVGGRSYRLDLAYPDKWLAIEYDGEDSHRGYLGADARRQNALESAGWTFRRYTADAYYRRPAEILSDIRAALART